MAQSALSLGGSTKEGERKGSRRTARHVRFARDPSDSADDGVKTSEPGGGDGSRILRGWRFVVEIISMLSEKAVVLGRGEILTTNFMQKCRWHMLPRWKEDLDKTHREIPSSSVWAPYEYCKMVRRAVTALASQDTVITTLTSGSGGEYFFCAFSNETTLSGWDASARRIWGWMRISYKCCTMMRIYPNGSGEENELRSFRGQYYTILYTHV